ncbi:MAG: DDE-type integrase/transposase/recombinase [Planctomycetota bacterium]
MSEPPRRSMWALIDVVSSLMMRSYMVARVRAFAQGSPVLRLLAERDHAHSEAVLLERELAIFQSQRRRYPAKHRPHFAPQERAEILQLQRLRGWSAKQTAARFVLHPNTVRNWQRAIREKYLAERAVGQPPWNKLHAGIRWTVHELRRLCPERDFGTRTITRYLLRAGIQISRASVRRILEEEPETSPRQTTAAASNQPMTRSSPEYFYNPPSPHEVWHMDLTQLRVLWRRYEVAAVIDGFSRKIVALKAYSGTPGTKEVASLIDQAIEEHQSPKFVITDRGGQFQQSFRALLQEREIEHARGRARTWQFNAKVERLFWSLKRWWGGGLAVPKLGSIQRRLDDYRTWHNVYRSHAALDTSTPDEAERQVSTNQAIRFTEGGDFEPRVQIERRHVGGDAKLLYPVIRMRPKPRLAA